MKVDVTTTVMHPGAMSYIGFNIVSGSEDGLLTDRADFELTMPGVNLLYSKPNCVVTDTLDKLPVYYQLHELESDVNVITGRFYSNGAPSSDFLMRCYFIAPETTYQDKEARFALTFDGENSAKVNSTFPLTMESTPSFAKITNIVGSGLFDKPSKGFNVELSDTTVDTNSIGIKVHGARFNDTLATKDKTSGCTIATTSENLPAQLTFLPIGTEDETLFRTHGTLMRLSLGESKILPAQSSATITCPSVAVSRDVKFFEPMFTITDETGSHSTYGVIALENNAAKFLVTFTTACICIFAFVLAMA